MGHIFCVGGRCSNSASASTYVPSMQSTLSFPPLPPRIIALPRWQWRQLLLPWNRRSKLRQLDKPSSMPGGSLLQPMLLQPYRGCNSPDTAGYGRVNAPAPSSQPSPEPLVLPVSLLPYAAPAAVWSRWARRWLLSSLHYRPGFLLPSPEMWQQKPAS